MRQTALLIAVLFAARVVFALTPAERGQVWDEVDRALQKQGVALDSVNARGWIESSAAMRSELINAADDVDFWRQLRIKVASLHDGQTFIGFPQDLPERYDTVPIRLVMAGGRVLVLKLSSSPEVQASAVRPGDELISVDGISAKELLLGNGVPHVSASTIASAEAQGVLRILTGTPGSSAKLILRHPGGAEYSATLKRDSGPKRQYYAELYRSAEPPQAAIGDSVLYMRFGRRMTPEQESALLNSTLEGTKAMILDLREAQNGVLPRQLLSKLSYFPLPIGPYREVLWETRDGDSLRAWRNFSEEWTVPAAKPYRGPVIAIVSAETRGVAEQFLQPLVWAQRVVLVGETTAGAGGLTNEIALTGGGKLTMAVAQPQWEDGVGAGIGFTPTVHAAPTPQGLAAGQDELLDAALHYLRVYESRNISPPTR